ncbi:transposase DDE domain protein [Leptospira weilii str. Ecochallenge]|uniref:Transposase DDE domain protein n=1 Tax=Leptospira weilii str. Ecochallenge TaxID=1049986 RepID=N1U976_9LEPT|nr:transposase DDE domain protein [Leptospira weilii str. Ecochallenge]
MIKRRNIRPHIRKKGEKPLIGKYKGKPRRWVVERTNSWHNRFRAIFDSLGKKSRKLSGFSLSCKLNHCF